MSAVPFVPLVWYGVTRSPLSPEEEEFVFTGLSLALLVALPLASFPVVRRLHDAGIPGYAALVLSVPMANLLLLLTLIFKRGTRGENHYGPPPR